MGKPVQVKLYPLSGPPKKRKRPFKWFTGENPTKSGEYLVTFLNRDGSRETTSDWFSTEENIWDSEGYPWKVIAWAPLPAPYRGKGVIG